MTIPKQLAHNVRGDFLIVLSSLFLFLSGILNDFSEHTDRYRSELGLVLVLHNFHEAILATPYLSVNNYRV